MKKLKPEQVYSVSGFNLFLKNVPKKSKKNCSAFQTMILELNYD